MGNKQIEAFLLNKYPGDGKQKAVREEIGYACIDFVESGLADKNFTKELCSENTYWSRVSEALLAAYLKKIGLNPKPKKGGGPDLLIIDNGQKIWIEVICPEPKGVPSAWTRPELVSGIDVPNEQILLRWTSAIKEKVEKLLGNPEKNKKGYIKKGIVASSDAYVIAVNGCQLRSTSLYPRLSGISKHTFAVEAVYAVGPYQYKLNPDTLTLTGAEYQHRPLIKKPVGKPVPADTFFDNKYKPISAIWAVDIDGTSVIGNTETMVVVHNHIAINRIRTGLLPAHYEYVVTPITDEEAELKRIAGNLSVKN